MEHTQEEEDNLTEICNVTTGDMLSENPEVAVSAFGPHRYSKKSRGPPLHTPCVTITLFVIVHTSYGTPTHTDRQTVKEN